MTIGQRIKEVRKAVGMTQEELGKKLGVSGSAIAQYETDNRNPKFDTIKRIADALQTPLSDFIDVEPLTIKILPKNSPLKSEKINRFEHAVSFLESLGYALGIEIGDAGLELYYSLTDIEKKKAFFLSEDEVDTLVENVENYTRFLLTELLKNKKSFDTSNRIPPIRSLDDLV